MTWNPVRRNAACLLALLVVGSSVSPVAAGLQFFDSCVVNGDCLDLPKDIDNPADDVGEIVPAIGGGVADAPGGDCQFGSSEHLIDRGTITPYPSGWSDAHGNSIHHSVHVCESELVDESGMRYIFWAVYQSLNSAEGWHARVIGPKTVWYEATTGDSVVMIDPRNSKGDDCDQAATFSLSAGSLISASMTWTEDLCDVRATKDSWVGGAVRWYGNDQGTESGSPTFVYGLVTKAAAGSVASLNVHHVERFCKYWSSCWGGQSKFEGDYQIGVTTTGATPPAGAVVQASLFERLKEVVPHGAGNELLEQLNTVWDLVFGGGINIPLGGA